MKLKPLASNMIELHTNKDTVVLFSYETPVAAYIHQTDSTKPEFIKTKGGLTDSGQNILSNTTKRHINKWLKENVTVFNHEPIEVDQSVLDELVK